MIIKQSEINDAIKEACFDFGMTISKFHIIEYGGITWMVRKSKMIWEAFIK